MMFDRLTTCFGETSGAVTSVSCRLYVASRNAVHEISGLVVEPLTGISLGAFGFTLKASATVLDTIVVPPCGTASAMMLTTPPVLGFHFMWARPVASVVASRSAVLPNSER